MKGSLGLAKLGILGFHIKNLAKKLHVQKLDKKVRNSCLTILQCLIKTNVIRKVAFSLYRPV